MESMPMNWNSYMPMNWNSYMPMNWYSDYAYKFGVTLRRTNEKLTEN